MGGKLQGGCKADMQVAGEKLAMHACKHVRQEASQGGAADARGLGASAQVWCILPCLLRYSELDCCLVMM